MMNSWEKYVRGLIHQDCDEDEDGYMDRQILENIKNSNKQWRANIENLLLKHRGPRDKPKPAQCKRRVEWTEQEDCELRKRIKIHGEGNWKEIVKNSVIIRSRYQGLEGEAL